MSDLLAELAETIVANAQRPAIVGVSGAVAVGKTTIAMHLADRIIASGCAVHVITTDAFLLSNADLAARDMVMRKGFPESYDLDALVRTIARVRHGQATTIPVYSHGTYDVLAGELEVVEPTDVLIVEGVVALQPPVREVLDVGIYVDAPEDVVRGWFVERFLRFAADGRDDPASFYNMFAALDADAVRAIAEATWDGINGVNLHEHIAPSGASADVVVRKGSDHRVLSVDPSA